MIVCATDEVEGTRALAARLATVLKSGDLVVLVGDLGAGKTAFTQGAAHALGINQHVTSPTFTLANRYEGSLVLNHLDVYRFDHIDEAIDLAIPELLDDGVTFIEWGDTIAAALPANYLEITLSYGDEDEQRKIEIRSVGPAWAARLGDVRSAVVEWEC